MNQAILKNGGEYIAAKNTCQAPRYKWVLTRKKRICSHMQTPLPIKTISISSYGSDNVLVSIVQKCHCEVHVFNTHIVLVREKISQLQIPPIQL